jgi:deoxyribonuclease V
VYEKPRKNRAVEREETLKNDMTKSSKLLAKLDAGFSVKKAHAMQLRLSKQVIREDMLPKNIRYVAGVDVAYTTESSIGAVAVLDYDSLSLVKSKTAKVKTRFPYIPTLLSFREIPPTLAAIKKLKTQPDVFLVNGQGIAHPYRLGFASHLGLVINKPTIGVAKSLLCGKVGNFNRERWAPIVDKGEVVGAAVARQEKKPIYVSIGHMISLERAIEIAEHCIRGHRLPEPLQMAHIIASRQAKNQKQD